MINRIRNFAIRKIWMIILFLPIITIMESSVTVRAFTEIYDSRNTSTPYVVLGTGHLIDGYHVVYGENLKATWAAHNFRLNSDGRFVLHLEYNYVSDNPGKVGYYADNIVHTSEVDLEYIGSIVLLQVGAVYILEPWGDFLHGDMTGLVPLIPTFENSKSCHIDYEGTFSAEINVTRAMTSAYGFEIKLSWVRVFAKKGWIEALYYQWLQGASDIWGGEMLELDETYSNISGRFGVYYPIPHQQTSSLHPYEFNYVEWIKENVLSSRGVIIDLGRGDLLIPYTSLVHTILVSTIIVAAITMVAYVKHARQRREER